MESMNHVDVCICSSYVFFPTWTASTDLSQLFYNNLLTYTICKLEEGTIDRRINPEMEQRKSPPFRLIFSFHLNFLVHFNLETIHPSVRQTILACQYLSIKLSLYIRIEFIFATFSHRVK